MENFQFRLLTYRLEDQKFLLEVAPDLTIVPWCGILRNMIVSHSLTSHLQHFMNTFWHTPGLTHTSQLLLRPSRLMYAAADFKPSNMHFVRWST